MSEEGSQGHKSLGPDPRRAWDSETVPKGPGVPEQLAWRMLFELPHSHQPGSPCPENHLCRCNTAEASHVPPHTHVSQMPPLTSTLTHNCPTTVRPHVLPYAAPPHHSSPRPGPRICCP